MSRLWCIVVLALLPLWATVGARASRTASNGTYRAGHNSARPHKSQHTRKIAKAARQCRSCARDTHGRIRRNEAAKSAFMRSTGYPHGRKGYVVDHIVPLECGGADSPSNMQWQTVAAAKAKDRTERRCR